MWVIVWFSLSQAGHWERVHLDVRLEYPSEELCRTAAHNLMPPIGAGTKIECDQES